MNNGVVTQGNSMNTPSMAQMRHQLSQHNNPGMMSNIGVEEAIDMSPKMYMNPSVGDNDKNGVQDQGLPAGGIDTNPVQPGQQMQPPGPPGQAGQMPGQMGQTPGQPGQPPAGSMAPGPQSNLLNLTRQGQAMNAMKPPGMAHGGHVQRFDDGGQPSVPLGAPPKKRKVFGESTRHAPTKVEGGQQPSLLKGSCTFVAAMTSEASRYLTQPSARGNSKAKK